MKDMTRAHFLPGEEFRIDSLDGLVIPQARKDHVRPVALREFELPQCIVGMAYVLPISFKSLTTRYAPSGSSRSDAYLLNSVVPFSERLYTINGGCDRA